MVVIKALKICRKVLLIIVIVLVVILIIGLLFLKFYPPIGDAPDKDKQKEYVDKTDLYYDKQFHNENDFMYEMAKLTDKLIIQENQEPVDDRPIVQICDSNGNYLGLAFHGVPGGHEFTSVMLGLYNAAGPGQPLDDVLKAKAQSINKQTDIRILVSLSCTMCPELVMSAQRIAALNPNVSTEVYDLNHFPAWRETYNVMSVPCMIINDGKPMFGKKNIDQLLELI